MPRRIARLITSFSYTEITNLLKSARLVIRHPGLDIRAFPKTNSLGRILIITPAKMGIAPDRNKVRRRIKSIFYAQKLFQGPFDLVVYAKKKSISLPFLQLNDLLIKAMNTSLLGTSK